MGCIPYQTVRDAQACLQRNVVLFKNLPHYVVAVNGPPGIVEPDRITVNLCPLPEPKDRGAAYFDVSITDPDLMVAGMQLGFVNLKNDTVYLSRIPTRVQSQGLADGNVRHEHITSFGTEQMTSFTRLSTVPEFHHQFNGAYPDVLDIIGEFEKSSDMRSRAFSRQFAISRDTFRKDFIVHYRTTQVGFGVFKDRSVNLVKEYRHLKEQFTEFGFNVIC